MTLPQADARDTVAGGSPLSRTVRRGEGRAVAAFAAYAFVLLSCYYLLKTLREPLLLDNGSAELKSYAYAVIACLLLVLVPAYGAVFRRTGKRQLLRWTTAFLITNLAAFALLGRAGVDIGFIYYVWVGIFGLAMLAQFWAHAAHVFGVERGQRLFPLIMTGAALGALAGPLAFRPLFGELGPWNVMLLTMGLLLLSLPLINGMGRFDGLRAASPAKTVDRRSNVLGGFALVLGDRYLLMLAAMAVLLNCVNTTGEYMLAALVIDHVQGRLAQDPTLQADALIGSFYAGFYLAANMLTVVIQVLIVGRLFRWIGVPGALLVLPIMALIGYGLIVFLPVFAIIRAFKVIENSTDYSLMNTARQALYLPLPVDKQFQGKAAIDTFFWRLGDVVQAGVVFVGLNWLGFGFRDFAMLNMLLAVVWLVLAHRIGRHYAERAASEMRSSLRRRWSGLPAGIVAGALACIALVIPASAAGQVFADHAPLELELRFDRRALCKYPDRAGCEDVPATLIHTDAAGRHEIGTTLRVRGRITTAGCSLPALFVFFDQATTAGTLFAGETMLPLTTHCLRSATNEQYVLKEYLAYRIYNTLMDKSLRVRLARITYRDSRKPDKPVVRYGFFTEHFDSVAARSLASVSERDEFDLPVADPVELGTFEVFQYLIGNTDWSVMAGHNVLRLREADGTAVAVPYDFDYSGLVNASYAVPPDFLPLRSVRQRLYRGFCRDTAHWPGTFARFEAARSTIFGLFDQIPGWRSADRARAEAYLAGFYAGLDDDDGIRRYVIYDCRAP